MFAGHVMYASSAIFAALVVSALSENYVALMASVIEKLETSEAIASSCASLLVNFSTTVTSSGRMPGTSEIVEIETIAQGLKMQTNEDAVVVVGGRKEESAALVVDEQMEQMVVDALELHYSSQDPFHHVPQEIVFEIVSELAFSIELLSVVSQAG